MLIISLKEKMTEAFKKYSYTICFSFNEWSKINEQICHFGDVRTRFVRCRFLGY